MSQKNDTGRIADLLNNNNYVAKKRPNELLSEKEIHALVLKFEKI